MSPRGSDRGPNGQAAPTSAAPPLLTIRGLVKTFTLHNVGSRQIRGLVGIDLDAHPGEHVALAGPSGSGKSTLLKCVYRSYIPTAGSIRLSVSGAFDAELTTLSDSALADARERHIGYVSQFLRADPRRSALEVVARAGVRRGLAYVDAQDAAASALRRLGVAEELWGSYASVLSGGEKQRVNLAAATIEPPKLLLLDEPVSALDPSNREAVLDLIAGLTRRGVTIVAVFHDLDAIRRLATRVLVLRDGSVVDEGSPDQVLTASAGVWT